MTKTSLLFLTLLFVGLTSEAQRGLAPEEASKRLFQRNDSNKDGMLDRSEFPKNLIRLFPRVDADKNGRISLEEDIAFRKRQKGSGAPTGVKVLRDIEYSRVGDRVLPLDLYLPAKPQKPMPVVMWIHGGGWKGGSKGSGGKARPMVDKGFAVVDVEYRLSGEAIFPAQIQDCKAAVRWVRANAGKYGFDPERIAVWGSSAGGHLVALLGTSGGEASFETDTNFDFSSRVNLVIDWFGPTELHLMNKHAVPGSTMDHDAPNSPESRLVGGPIQEKPFISIARKASPVSYVSADDPGFLIVHGDQDKLVSYKQSVVLHRALLKAGVKSDLQIVKGGNHGFRLGEKKADLLAQEAFEFLMKKWGDGR